MDLQQKKDYLNWQYEARIFEHCVRRANELIAELESSGGDHYEDIRMLEGLIESWQLLHRIAEEQMQAIKVRAKGD